MTFLAPLFLAGSLAVAIPIVLHLLKREPEPRVKFATVKLLKRAAVERTEKRQLRELLLLALRVAALGLLATAFARPYFRNGAASAASGATIVAIDTSYSMSAPGRFERAQALARASIDRAPAGDLVGVVSFSDGADVVAPPTLDRTLAASAVDRLTAGFGSTRYRSALNAATQALGGRRGSIVVVSDLQESGWDAGDRAAVPESARIEIADVGALPANLAVTSIHRDGDHLVASIRNAGDRPREVRAHLAVDGRPAGDASTSIAANASSDVVFRAGSRGAAAEVAIEDRDGLQADNVRFAVLEPSEPSVLIVTATGDLPREAFYVEQALGAASGSPQAAGVSGASLSKWTPSQLAPYSTVVVLSTRGLEPRARQMLATYVGGGGGLVVAAGPDLDGDVAADLLGEATALSVASVAAGKAQARTLAPPDVRHPIFQAFGSNVATLGLVQFANLARVGASGCDTVARFTTGETAVLDCAAGQGRAVVIASDLDNRWNDFPLHPSFVPFVREVVRYASNARPDGSEYLIADVPAGIRQTPGISSIGSRRVAINVDPKEGDPARVSANEFQAAVARLKDAAASGVSLETRQQEEGQHLWSYLLIAMLGVLLVEGAVASRS